MQGLTLLPVCQQFLPLCSGGGAGRASAKGTRMEWDWREVTPHPTTPSSQAVIHIVTAHTWATRPGQEEEKKQDGEVGKKKKKKNLICTDAVHGLALPQHQPPHTYFNFGFGVLKTLSSSSISGPLSLGFSISSVSYKRSKSSSTSGTCSAGSCSESRTYTQDKSSDHWVCQEPDRAHISWGPPRMAAHQSGE